jgi:hypothetical protein
MFSFDRFSPLKGANNGAEKANWKLNCAALSSKATREGKDHRLRQLKRPNPIQSNFDAAIKLRHCFNFLITRCTAQ